MTKIKLFLASYLSTDASTYFNRVLIVSNLAQHPDPKVSEFRESFFQSLRNTGRQYVENIQHANSIYRELNLPELELPRFPDDYFTWVDKFRKYLRGTAPEKSEEQWIVDYGFYMASLCADLSILIWSLNLHLYALEAPEQLTQIEKTISDSNNTKFLWAGTALLLGQNNNLRFLWEEWQSLNNLLEQLFTKADVSNRNKLVETLSFLEALLPKFHEKFEIIVQKLNVI